MSDQDNNNSTTGSTAEPAVLVDLQNQSDARNVPLNKVGIADLRYPITVLDKANKKQQYVLDYYYL